MENVIKFVSIVATIAMVQGCTTHHHNYYTKPTNFGIAATPKGANGAEGRPGMVGAGVTPTQRKQQLEEQGLYQAQQEGNPSGGIPGSEGSPAAAGQPGAAVPGHPAPAPKRQPDPFGPAFIEEAILKVLQWCITLRCGS